MIEATTHGLPVDITVTPADARYPGLVEGYNHRFVGRPEYVRLAASTAHVVAALDEAVSTGRRIAVRSGGHCFEDFSASPDSSATPARSTVRAEVVAGRARRRPTPPNGRHRRPAGRRTARPRATHGSSRASVRRAAR